METKALKNLLETLRKNGVTKYKTSELELELESSSLRASLPSPTTYPYAVATSGYIPPSPEISKTTPTMTPTIITNVMPDKQEISDEDMLFWSVPISQADKKASNQ